MTAPTRQRIDFVNTSYDEVEKMLTGGKSPREVADLLAEPVPNVMGVWSDLQNTGKVEAQNFTQQAARPASVQNIGHPAAPRHTPDPALSQRIANSTDLLVKAAEIDDKRIQNALGRARKAMVDLAGLVEGWEGKAAARSRIARLEAELRIAKAELRGEPGTVTSSDKSERSPAQLAALEKMRAAQQPVDCPTCGKTCQNPAGLSAHQRGGKCTGTAA